MADAPTLRLVGGPTALISYGGLRLLTDPTFDPPCDYPRPGTSIVLRKLVGPAVSLDDVLPVDYAFPVIEQSLAIYHKWKAGEDVSKLMHKG